MPPRPRRRVAPSQLSSTRTLQAQAHTPAVDHGEESFNLDDVSGGDDNDNNNDNNNDNVPTDRPDPTDDPTPNATSQHAAANAGVNNPDFPPPRVTTAADVHYFFKKDGDKMVCEECK